ncbi:MAG TPA: TAXI family TRAP transporter solute-binding subunit [Alphaproteobacteria bacterium]|nr:TAXI family TRAP transporter solute-binding subunit [Alphaproteobacteria bacterium]
MISRRTVLALAATVALTAGTFVWTPAKAGQDILIGGGSVTGVYYQVALNVCNLLNKHAGDKYNCVGRPALGSVFNIRAVKRTLLDFGVAQSDRNFEAFRGRGDWEGKPMEDLRSVFSMHPETVLLVTRADTGINSVSDLKGKTVNIGNPGSGQRGNAEDVLRLYGIDKDNDIDAQGLQQQEASRALVDQKIDAFFYTVGNPSAAIEEPANSTQIKIISINDAAIYGFVDERPYYVMTVIPAGTYKGVDEDVETYAVTATVVTSASASEEMVYDTVKTVFENLDELKATHAAFRVLEPKAMLKGLTAPLHKGAEKYYKERGWK